MSFAQYGRCALAGLLAVVTTFAFPRAPAAAGAKQLGHRHPGVHLARALGYLDDRFHETGRHGTGDLFVDSPFGFN